MGERHNTSTTSIRWTLPVTAAALACLAGTATALGQGGTSVGPRPIQQAGSQPVSPGEVDAKVKVDDNLIVDLHVNDESLANVLQMLSIQSQKNIIASRNVAATITANLYGVSFYEALDAILHVNGYGYVERGNFIYIYTLEELTKIAEASRVQVWKVMKLNYLNSTDAAEFVKPLLSERGQIKTNGRVGTFSMSDGPSGGEDFAHESTLLVFDFEENIVEIERVLAQMDTRPAQVLVEATILQTALNEANAFGVDFAVLGDLSFGDFLTLGGPLKAVDALIGGATPPTGGGSDGEGRAIVSTAGNTGGPATFKAGIVQNDVAAFLRLLDEVSDTSIISRPNLLALNRVPARVLVGRKVGYLNTTSTDTATTQTVEFLETGTQLYFRPFISADGMIRMELKPKVSEAVIRNVTNTGGAAVTIPDEISNELTTNVMVRDGQTIVLGGLFKESTQATRRQIPFLGDIPIIGAAFRGHDDNTQRQEIIFLITPTIMSDSVLLEQGQRGMAAVERVRAGSREGLLPWSRERRTQQMVVQATELAQQGRREEALYRVQRALRLNRNQPDAIALREELSGTRRIWPSRSMQDEIVRGELERRIQRAEPRIQEVQRSNTSSARTLAGSGMNSSDTGAFDPSMFDAETAPVMPDAPAPMQQADAEPAATMSDAGEATDPFAQEFDSEFSSIGSVTPLSQAEIAAKLAEHDQMNASARGVDGAEWAQGTGAGNAPQLGTGGSPANASTTGNNTGSSALGGIPFWSQWAKGTTGTNAAATPGSPVQGDGTSASQVTSPETFVSIPETAPWYSGTEFGPPSADGTALLEKPSPAQSTDWLANQTSGTPSAEATTAAQVLNSSESTPNAFGQPSTTSSAQGTGTRVPGVDSKNSYGSPTQGWTGTQTRPGATAQPSGNAATSGSGLSAAPSSVTRPGTTAQSLGGGSRNGTGSNLQHSSGQPAQGTTAPMVGASSPSGANAPASNFGSSNQQVSGAQWPQGTAAHQGVSSTGTGAQQPSRNASGQATTVQPVAHNASQKPMPAPGSIGFEIGGQPNSVALPSSDQNLDTYTGKFALSFRFSWDFFRKPTPQPENPAPASGSMITNVPTDTPSTDDR